MAVNIADLVLIYFEDKPMVFARVESIEPDAKRGWYQISLLMLQVPVQVVTWILRDAYINGDEFTMNGKRMRLERVKSPVQAENRPRPQPEKKEKNGNVISLSDLKKK